ncbi:MAG: hypothetical protein PHZ00_01305 [Candidatus Peribacteraceae bacterium]|nr:hypothetical protein [Candidatus Peribacteraceae bacterium]
MHSSRIAFSLGLTVIIVALTVMFGWIFNIPILLNFHTGWTEMRFFTAFCFVCSGGIVLLLSLSPRHLRGISQLLLPILAFVILLIMVSLLLASIFHVDMEIESLFVLQPRVVLPFNEADLPSLSTMGLFILFASTTLVHVFSPDMQDVVPRLRSVGWFLCIAGATALSGYSLGMPFLFFSFPGYSNAMSLPTAVLFVALGTGYLLSLTPEYPQEDHRNHI